ncbi:glycoside hydrolase family 5 protein [Fluoribacter dumoffii]|uniref:cellulase family glycosylhydrolase n=1 Tax=Fluoribacter dumoffii TaxID=463 RepID=UPI00224465F2|nr:cellulase family glycosylhydrolase [Fluoribacter dumoffii]MCW8418214.1 glycoside hydrolase family 5 protein [Fluoribacter dumoffii]MCW8453944.1 glycoside hydrolase family 5 protein [Fluoribacter dumoffii]MCW8461985.1 glycoside hydrolase family 5 protein [Fluoribacter dumoffii]MCW8482197.1 glycoside hydrolase family 5 protein [Fluoribacter dumoffii]
MFLKKYSRLVSLTALLFFAASQSIWAFNTKDGNIYDANGNQISIDGIAWIGFQDSNFLGGLWNVPFNPIGTQNGVIQLLTSPWNVPGSNIPSMDKGVSFKTIRLPIQPGIWGNAATVQQSPFDFAVTDINNPEAGNGPFCDWTKGADASSHCIQAKSAPDLLTATINEFNKQNILVMLDVHHRPGLGDSYRDGTVVAADYSLKNYHDDLANFVKNAPANLLGIDIYNEPHQLFWYQDNTQTTPVQPAWIKVIAAAATAAYDSNQSVLLFVEGPGGTAGNDPYDPVYSNTSTICLPSSTKIDNTSVISVTTDSSRCPAANPLRVTNIGSNWGENFRSLLDPKQSINGVGGFDVATFRTQLIQAIQTNNFSDTDPNVIADWLLGTNNDGNQGHLVFAPHLYGAQVAGWQSDANDSPIRFDWNFGFLLNSGFPFVIGELGYDVQIPASGGEDFFLDSVAPYLIDKKINHNLFFWTFNNADYPVGLRASDSDLSLFAWKEQDLHHLFYAILPVQQYGTLCVKVPAPTGYTGTQFPVITATAGNNSYKFNLTAFNILTCLNNVVTGTYSLSGSTISNSDGINYVPESTVTGIVSQNTETDVTVNYIEEPTGNLNISISGNSDCPINSEQVFTVTYSSGSSTHSVQVTGTLPKNVTLPVGNYSINVTPLQLPNTQCMAKFNSTVSISANTTQQEFIQYSVVANNDCSINAQCSTWGTPQDSWSGSSCNLYINTKSAMTNPAVFSIVAKGITAVTSVWNATATFQNETIVMTLTDAVYIPNIGFNANGVISLPSQAMLTTNGQTYTCPVTAAIH